MKDKPCFVFIRKPVPSEVPAIYALMHGYADEGLILERSQEEICGALGAFLVAVIEDKVVGVISSFDYGQGLVEIRSMAVDKSVGGAGIGSVLLSQMVHQILADRDETRIFALSYSPEFFMKNGFIEVPKGMLPEKIWKDCFNCKDKDNCGETALIFSLSRVKEK